MAGHSKWANIKHQKARSDAKKGKIFTKLIREIVVAARMGGTTQTNPRLRAAVDNALSQNMTRDAIERAIQRGVGGIDSDQMESIVYEGYGPAGIALLVDCLTDNRNRTAAAIRRAFSRSGGQLGTPGSVAYLFEKKGFFLLENRDEAKLLDTLLQLPLEALEGEGSAELSIQVQPTDFESVRAALMEQGITMLEASLSLQPLSVVVLTDADQDRFQSLLESLEALDEVQEITHNACLKSIAGLT